MAYTRFSFADVYVYMDVGGYLNCCGCILQKSEWVDDPSKPIFGGYLKPIEPIIPTKFVTTQGMIEHLALHRAAGHDVPDGVEDELRADDDDNFVNYSRCDVDGCEERPTCGAPTPEGYVSCCSIEHAQSLGGFLDWPDRKKN